MDINANNLEDSNLSNYSNFLKLSSALRKLAKRYHIDTPKEQMVVEAVLYSYLCDETLIVFDLILNKNIASQATIHATMKSLIKKDLIKLNSHMITTSNLDITLRVRLNKAIE